MDVGMGMGRIAQQMSRSVERYSLSHIRPYHREIARRLVLGQTQAQIAQELQMSQSRLSIIVNSPLFKLELKRLEKIRDEGVGDIGRTLKELSPIALETIERTMYSAPSYRLRFDAARDILDRSGYGAVSKSIVGNINSNDYSSMTLDEIKKLVKERFQRIQEDVEKKAQEVAQAQATEVQWEEVGGNGCEERSDDECQKQPRVHLMGDLEE